MFPPKPFDSLEGLDAFRFFFKYEIRRIWGFILGPQNAYGITFCGGPLKDDLFDAGAGVEQALHI